MISNWPLLDTGHCALDWEVLGCQARCSPVTQAQRQDPDGSGQPGLEAYTHTAACTCWTPSSPPLSSSTVETLSWKRQSLLHFNSNIRHKRKFLKLPMQSVKWQNEEVAWGNWLWLLCCDSCDSNGGCCVGDHWKILQHWGLFKFHDKNIYIYIYTYRYI